MKYENVCIEAVGYRLPEEVVTTDEVERRLGPVYARLRLPPGRLELMTGIRERRLWRRGVRAGENSVLTVRRVLEMADFPPEKIGCLVHGSVTRDYLEPATASGVHHGAGLPERCHVFDVSNACLGLLTGAVMVANMIELGQIEAGIVVGTEDSRSLLETTIAQLNSDTTLTRQSFKLQFASLTIGSGSAALLLTRRGLSRSGHRLLGGGAIANTRYCGLCQSDEAVRTGDAMKTDSETLLVRGVETAAALFPEFLSEVGWRREDPDHVFCHQVGKAHQRRIYETLQLDFGKDFSTFETLGNTGSTALPTALGIGIERGLCRPEDKIALLGIGSGIHSIMLGVEW